MERQSNPSPTMKKILVLTTFALSIPLVHAQQAPNREGVGGIPNSVPAATPAAPHNKPPGADDKAGGTEQSPAERFIHKAGKAGRMGAKVAEMAATKASREDIKGFAAMVAKDHSAANMELAKISKSMGLGDPATMDKIDDKEGTAKPTNDPSGRKKTENSPKEDSESSHAEQAEALKEKMGMAFDAAFIELMGDCHKKDIALFEKAQSEVKAPELKAFIDKTLPVLKTHASALAALIRKDPNRPDARTGSPAPGEKPGSAPPNR